MSICMFVCFFFVCFPELPLRVFQHFWWTQRAWSIMYNQYHQHKSLYIYIYLISYIYIYLISYIYMIWTLCVHMLKCSLPFLRVESQGSVSDPVWNGDSLAGLGGVWLPPMHNHVILFFGSISLLLVRENISKSRRGGTCYYTLLSCYNNRMTDVYLPTKLFARVFGP